MKRALNIIIVLGFILAPVLVNGQLKYTSTNYMISLPIGDGKDFIGDASFRGFGFETGKFVNDNISVGFGISWNVFNENITDELIESGTVTIAGKQFRYLNALPIYINTDYHFGTEDSKIRPYAGIGIGTMYKEQRIEIGTIAISDSKWHFLLNPHAGLLYSIGPDANINLDFRYHQGFGDGDFEADFKSFLSINIGMKFIFF